MLLHLMTILPACTYPVISRS